MISRTYKTEAVVLKRRNQGEADRIVTLFTKHHGKIVAVAKGVRRIHSRRAGSLEPGTQAQAFFATGKNFDIITEVKLINSFPRARTNLTKVTQLHQILEIVDLLTRENQDHPKVYQLLIDSLASIDGNGSSRNKITDNVRLIIHDLGFGFPPDNSETALKHHLENITEKKLNSKAFLVY